MSQSDPQHEDPALKAAIGRVAGSERAPDALRARVAGILRQEAVVAHPEERRWRLGPQRMRTLLAASIAVIAVGVAAYQIRTQLFPPRETSTYSYNYKIESSFADAMVQAHSRHAALKWATSQPAAELAQEQEKLSKQLGFPVMLPADLGDGWVNAGSGTTKVGDTNAGYVLYSKNGQTITLFSLPASVLHYASDGATYEQTAAGGALSGYRSGDGLYCLVASDSAGAPDLKTLTALRDYLRSGGRKSCGGGGVESLAERI